MSTDQSAPGMCSAYGCPLFATVGAAGKWVCFVHAHCQGNNDAVTAELRRHMPIVNAILDTRRFAYTDEWPTVKQGIAQALRAANRSDMLPAAIDSTNGSGTPEMRRWLQRLERELLTVTTGIGVQATFATTTPTAPVVGPTHASGFHPYAESDA